MPITQPTYPARTDDLVSHVGAYTDAHISAATGAHAASAVAFSPTGAISASTVQAAIAEVDTEKQAVSAKGAANGYASLDASVLVPVAQLPGQVTINAQTGTTYTLVLADAGKRVTMTNAAANTLTVPANATTAFPVGTVIQVAQLGAGQTTIAPAAGVTLASEANMLKIAAAYTSATLYKEATNTWTVEGALTA